MILPLIFLSFGAVLAGYIFKDLFIGNQSDNFWKFSIFFLEKISHEHIPLWLLIITPILVITAIPISYYYFIKNTKIIDGFKNTNTELYHFLLNKWYIDEFYNVILVKPIKKIGLLFWKQGDGKTIDRFGPDGVSKLIKFISNKAIQFQSGYIYDYAFVMLIGLSALITFLILH